MKLSDGLEKISADGLAGPSALVFLSSIVVNFLNLAFWLYIVRKLPPAEYAVLNSLFSLSMILSLPAGVANAVVTKFVAQFHGEGNYPKIYFLLSHLGKRILILASLLFIIFALFSPKLALFMKIPSVGLIVLTGAGLFFSILSPVPNGALIGLQFFLAASLAGIIAAVIKLACSIGLVSLGFGTTGAMFGVVISVVVGLLIISAKTAKELLHHSDKKKYKVNIDFIPIYAYFLPASVSVFCFMVLTNIDIILVKHYFPPLEAGYYSIAQMVGKIILFLPSAIGAVMFPKVANSYAQNKDTTDILKKSLLIVSALCSGAAVICLIFAKFILVLLTGNLTEQCIPLARLFALAMLFFALTQILMAYHLSIHNFRFIFLMALFTALQVTLVVLFHQKLINILYILLSVSSLSFIVGLKMVNFKNQ